MKVEKHRNKYRAVWRDSTQRKQRRSFDTEGDALLSKAVADANTPELAVAYLFNGLGDSGLRLPQLPPGRRCAPSPPTGPSRPPSAGLSACPATT